ncbi:MAG: hypothetical protein GKS07_00725 [Nitrosopumilus sp.]|nr:MAG: hypothetical protein GKS07_00725 [Nitrosopumilus sp.]
MPTTCSIKLQAKKIQTTKDQNLEKNKIEGLVKFCFYKKSYKQISSNTIMKAVVVLTAVCVMMIGPTSQPRWPETAWHN